ncbi:uromodulin-like 1 [Aplochiton taeniatus]
MSWMLYFCQAVALLGICSAHNTNLKGYDLSLSSYHLCPANETSVVTNIVSNISPVKVKRPCGDWLPWKTCEVTLYKQTYATEYQNVTKEIIRCCKAYEQVGSYCALRNGGWCFNVTVTVKTDYQVLVSVNHGMLNHTRLLHSAITGALDALRLSVNYVGSWPVDPFRSASSLLVSSPDTLSLSNATSRLQLLLKNIEEVSSVSVEDVDECAHAALRGCSAQANCTNTVGSYLCTCLPGYTDRSPNITGTYCQGGSNATGNYSNNLMPTPMQVTKTPLHNASYPMWISNQTWPSTNPYGWYARNHTGWAWNTTNSTVPAQVTPLQLSNVTGTSFCVSWNNQSQGSTVFLVVLMHGSTILTHWETDQTKMEVQGLQAGVLYYVNVTSTACGSHGGGQGVHVRTAAQTLGATARLTNLHFTYDLLNCTSQAYLNLTLSIEEEIRQSLTPSLLEMVRSGEVRIQITGLAPGSVVVNFTIVFSPSPSQDVLAVSSALMASLQNSSKYTMDRNYTSISDVDECATEEHDCSPWASCQNTWGSYNCTCLTDYIDTNPEIPGRACKAATTAATTATSSASAAAKVSTITTPPPLTASATPATTHHLPTRLPLCVPPMVSILDSIWVECRPSATTVTVARNLLTACHIPHTDLYLGQPGCGINGGNTTHAQLTVAWSECGTELRHNGSHYTALVNLSNSMPNDTAMRAAPRLLVPIVCSYANNVLISTGYNPVGYEMIKDAIMGFGTFRVTVQLLNGTLPLPQNYSMSPEEAVVVEVSLNSTGEHINLVIDRCWATPSSNPLDPVSYAFMENSCPVPNTFTAVLENGNSSKSRLSVRIFSFVNHNVIYLHCQVQICIKMGSDTCVPNCFGPTRKLSRSFGSAEASCGPFLRSVQNAVQEGEDSFQLIGFCLLGVGLSLFFIGCFACLFYYNRNRIGHYNFSLKPKQENFTYHVFNT